MRFRNEERDESAATPAETQRPSGLGQAGAEFLAAGDEAIARILSGNPTEFLRANRQQGGE
jgi:hypothetical protein